MYMDPHFGVSSVGQILSILVVIFITQVNFEGKPLCSWGPHGVGSAVGSEWPWRTPHASSWAQPVADHLRHTGTCTHTHTLIQACTFKHIHAHTHACIDTHTCTYTCSKHIHIHMNRHIYTLAHISTHIHTHKHICTQTYMHAHLHAYLNTYTLTTHA